MSMSVCKLIELIFMQLCQSVLTYFAISTASPIYTRKLWFYWFYTFDWVLWLLWSRWITYTFIRWISSYIHIYIWKMFIRYITISGHTKNMITISYIYIERKLKAKGHYSPSLQHYWINQIKYSLNFVSHT